MNFELSNRLQVRSSLAYLMICAVLLCISQISKPAWAGNETIHVITTEWYPYFYKENGEVKGRFYHDSKAIVEGAEFGFNPEIYPWARAYRKAQKEENTMLVGVARTPFREGLFSWVGPINSGKPIYYFKKKDVLDEVTSIEQLKNHRVAVVRDSIYHQELVYQKFPEENIIIVPRKDLMIPMIEYGRVSFVLTSADTFWLLLEDDQELANKFEAGPYSFTATQYLAMSKQTTPEVLDKLKTTMQELITEGVLSF